MLETWTIQSKKVIEIINADSRMKITLIIWEIV